MWGSQELSVIDEIQRLVVEIKRAGWIECLDQKVYVHDFGDGAVPGGDGVGVAMEVGSYKEWKPFS